MSSGTSYPSALFKAIQVLSARGCQVGCLSVWECDRLFHFASSLHLAIERFEGNKDAVYAWLRRPQRGLAKCCAIDLLTTSTGTEAIRELMGRLEHGIPPSVRTPRIDTENASNGLPVASGPILVVVLWQSRFRGAHHGPVQETSGNDLLGTS